MTMDIFFGNLNELVDIPDYIPKLREMILQLAVRGKLVEQNPNHEPASMLLDKIKVKKERLVKEGTIRNQKKLPSIRDDEVPYELPESWEWVRFGNIVQFSAGRTPPTKVISYWSNEKEGFPWVTIGDMMDGGRITNTKRFISPKAVDEIFKKNPVKKSTLLMSYKLTIGKVSFLDVPAYHNEAIISIYPYYDDMDVYLFKVLPIFAQMGLTKDAIKGKTLNQKTLKILLVPLPPLQEQHRIVAKIDKLMSVCDQLENQKQQSLQVRRRINTAAIYEILKSLKPDEFEEKWRFIHDNFELLYDDMENVTELRQAILQLAVMGKLVEQDSGDEPASVLLEKIRVEKERLVKEGKIRKQKKLPTIKDDEVPYGLPGGWEWVRFGNVMHLIMGQSPPGTSYNKVGNGVPLINGPVEFGPKPLSKTIINQYTTSPNKMCKKGDLLLCVRGSTTGRTNIAGYDGCIGRGVASIRAYMYQQYLYLFILSKREHLLHLGRGIAFPSIKKDMLKLLLCPLPPLPEQKRIFTKYKKLMSLCDQLEANIEQSQKHSGKLLNAVIHEVLTG